MRSLSEWVRLFLNDLEDQEAKNLAWGYVEGAFTDAELDELANAFIQKHEIANITADDIINELVNENMIGIVLQRGKEVWRTRMAETVRLMARLRQWFPSKTWQASPTLVSDFRFQQRRRVYPRRHIEATTLLEKAGEYIDPLELEALKCFMMSKGTEFLLSDFQMHATLQMFRNLKEDETNGFITTAGTGTGKTLSFYLPALTWIASRIDRSYWIKAIALYPRNELLKDQFSDTFGEIRQINASGTLSRPITIGAVFGDTPYSADKVGWNRTSYGYVCPYLKCPKCNSDLVWMLQDHKAGLENLTCTKKGCGTAIGAEVMPLTRQSMLKNPPDLMFTTTEMMNRYMSDPKYGALIGLRTVQPPRIVLLDEVHTYTGTHGAQVALLLRRWQYALAGAPLQFTGLSATLREAGEFMSLLTGVSRHHITEIDASLGESETKGNEYQLVLRGDAAAGTSLLSTSIQAAMLLRRMLDLSVVNERHVTAYGSKLFLFTDDLDVTNRLFHTILDAEGRNNDRTNARRLDREPLAALRSHHAPDATERMENGQSWMFAENIGHDLAEPLPIGRTSSQDAGVDATAEVIVSSPSLEVGFNDKRVGAVIQHKAPRDLAQFLQRKGRAGRDPQMRPWMVTVLSDYGRDRFMYQSYDTLFQPTIERLALPIENRYVLRIQAAFAFMDWVAYELKEQRTSVGPLWYLFAQPYDDGPSNNWAEDAKKNQLKVVDLIKRVLELPPYRERMETYIRKALRVTREAMQPLLWEPPRSLMLEVLPTIMRRLQSNWGMRGANAGVKEIYTAQHPMPEFVPSNLFSELSLPEVSIVVPGTTRRDEQMDIVQAMKAFAPGRVTRRFGVDHGGQSHWIAPPSIIPNADGLPLMIMVSSFCNEGEYRELGLFQYYEEDQLMELPVIRPWKLRVAQSPINIDTKSNAQLVWRSQLSPALLSMAPDTSYDELLAYGRCMEVPKGIRWSSLIRETHFFTHDTHSAVSVRRFAIGSEASVRRVRVQEAIDLSIRFGLEPGQPAALGFVQQVDGIRFVLDRIPESIISGLDENKGKIRSFRTMYFQNSVIQDEILQEEGNSFALERMAEIYMSALLHTALTQDCTLEQACERIHAESFERTMNEVMNVVFQALYREEESDIEDEAQYQRTHLRLIGMFERPAVRERLKMLARKLWVDEDEGWQKWARRRFIATIGEALLQACLDMAGTHRNGDLLLDIGGGPRQSSDGQWSDSDCEIWITETIEGGSGIIEEIASGYQRDPRRFFRLVESALGPSDAEIMHAELSSILDLLQTDTQLRDNIHKFRLADSFGETRKTITQIRSRLDELGVLAIHPVMNGLFNRILRPGSNSDTDRFIHDLLKTWEREENRLGVEMDVRVFAYVCSADIDRTANLSDALQHIDLRALSDRNWRYNVIYGMLWPQGSQIRCKALESYNPFSVSVPTDRDLVLDSMVLHRQVDYKEPDWRNKLLDILTMHGSVQLLVPQVMKLDIGKIILEMTSEPLDLGFLHVYPRIEGMIRERGNYVLNFEIREALQ